MEIRTLVVDSMNYIHFSKGRNLFIQNPWRQDYDSGLQFFGVFKGQELLAVFHAYSYKRYGKSFMISAPFSAHCGLELSLSGEGLYKRQSETKRILRAVADFLAKEARNTFVELALPPAIQDMQPFTWAGLESNVRYTYRLAIEPDENTLLSGMSPERRKNIRDAAKAGYTVSVNAFPEQVLAIVEATLENGDAGFDKSLMRRMVRKEHPCLFWITVSQNGAVKATTVVGVDSQNAWYLMGGHSGDGDTRAGAWSVWQAILESRERGIHTFDFMGSSLPRIEQFFRGFGGALTPSFSVSGGKGIFGAIKDLKARIKR